MNFVRLLYSFNLVSFLIVYLRIQIAFSFESVMVEGAFLLSMSLSSPIKDLTFFTVRQFCSDLFVFLSMYAYSVLSVFELVWAEFCLNIFYISVTCEADKVNVICIRDFGR